MTNVDSLKDFFFILIPGVTFLLINHYLGFFSFNDVALSIALLAVLGFILGFVFDGIYIKIRKCLNIDKFILCSIKEDQLTNSLFDQSKEKLNKGLRRKEQDVIKDERKAIYLMDHLATSKNFGVHISYAVTRASFWGNFFIVSLFTLVIIFFDAAINNKDLNLINTLISIISLIISGWLFWVQRKRFFTSVIYAFAMSELYKAK